MALETLASNLKALKAKDRDLSSDGKIAKKAGLDQKTVNRIVNKKHEPTLAALSQLSAAVGLQHPWQLLVPNLVPSNPPMLAAESASLLKLLENIAGTKLAMEGFLRAEGNTEPGALTP